MKAILNKAGNKIERITGVQDQQDKFELYIITFKANKRKAENPAFNSAKFIAKQINHPNC